MMDAGEIWDRYEAALNKVRQAHGLPPANYFHGKSELPDIKKALDRWAETDGVPLPLELEDAIGPDSHEDGRIADAQAGPRPLSSRVAPRVVAPMPATALRDTPGTAPLIEWPGSDECAR